MLTVRYVAGGKEVFPTEKHLHTAGDEYYVVVPQYPGYDVEVEILRGTITEDMEVAVRYTPKSYRVTVQYLTLDGKKAAETSQLQVMTGEAYRVYTKPIEGYQPLKMRISGVNPGRDEQYTVIYVPEDEMAGLVMMEDYETAGYVGETCVQIGICFE